jgi:pimeloyl-ACP methyl ester carboxylesterase
MRHAIRLPAAALSTRKGLGLGIAGLSAAALAATAGWVWYRARRAEASHRPAGRFVEADGVRLHYIDRGLGPPVVLLHGTLVRLEDLLASGLVDRLSERHRVIAFDRPGFGFSERPRTRAWTADAQAELLEHALARLGVQSPAVVGHSWGTMVAAALALRQESNLRRLVLLSGFYFPEPRVDALVASPAATPVLGDVMRYTVSALTARAMLGRAMRTMFAPEPVPAGYAQKLSREMLLRPSQLRATAEEAALLLPSAPSLAQRYASIGVPTTILAGEEDKVVDPVEHSRRLAGLIPGAELRLLPGVGHMVHFAALDEVVDAVDAAAPLPIETEAERTTRAADDAVSPS